MQGEIEPMQGVSIQGMIQPMQGDFMQDEIQPMRSGSIEFSHNTQSWQCCHFCIAS